MESELDPKALESAWLAHDNACPGEHWRKRDRMAAGIRAYLSALAPAPSQPDGEIERRAAAYDYLEAPDAVDWKSRAEALSAALDELESRARNFWELLQGEHGVKLTAEEGDDHNVYGFFLALARARSLLNGEKGRG